MDSDATAAPAEQAPDEATTGGGPTTLALVDGSIVCSPGEGAATLSWMQGTVAVTVDGEAQAGTRCSVRPGQAVVVRPEQTDARVVYDVDIASSRMQATLAVRPERGCERALRDAPAAPHLVLEVDETFVDAPAAQEGEASAALQQAGVVFGLTAGAVAAAIDAPGVAHEVATGRAAVEGSDGSLEPLVDFAALRNVGVPSGTALLRVVPRRDGIAGMDVTGKELRVRAVRDARVRAGDGAQLQPDGRVVARVDGQPCFDGDALVEVRHELQLEEVDNTTGNIEFCGSVRVTGSVHEGRRVVARDELVVDGNADRAWLESGSHMQVHGTIMKSVLRAGGDRAVAASVVDAVDDVPRLLAEAATRARELRDVAQERGQEMSHALSLQVVLERLYRPQLAALQRAARELEAAGERHVDMAGQFAHWHRALTTCAISNLGAEEFNHLLSDMATVVQRMREATDQHADLVVTYMQASEAEATGTVTLDGKGIFNSRVVAWGGLAAKHPHAVVRGGEIVSHGPVTISEIGAPSGSNMHVHLGTGAVLDADLVYAGTNVTSPGASHRFIADRSNVKVSFGQSGMSVDSLAA